MKKNQQASAVIIALLLTVALLTGCTAGPSTTPRSGSSGTDAPVTQPGTPSAGQSDTRNPLTQPGAQQPSASKPAEGMATIKVYFTPSADAATGKTAPVSRQVPKARATIRGAMEELLKGPTKEERNSGYTSWFSEKTTGMVKGVSLHEGRAIVDFADFSRLIPNASTSAGAQQLLAELTRTACQFPNVREVEYRFDGSNQAFMAWLQMVPGAVSANPYR